MPTYRYGTSLADTIYGDSGVDYIYGYGGNDWLYGDDGNDWIYGGLGNDRLYGQGGNDWLFGGADDDMLWGGTGDDYLSGGSGDDTLDGGFGADSMEGGDGNDIYYVASADDSVHEYADEGTDTVHVSFSYTLTSNVENLILDGTWAINGFGNDLDNNIYGNSAANYLYGYDGEDYLSGGGGADVLVGDEGDDSLNGGSGDDLLIGGANNDWLYGGAGADDMYGGTGNDEYFVDNSGDTVTEYAGQGSDTVYSSISYTLGANVENLTLMIGAGAINGFGNGLDNDITGNGSNNILTGGDGNDELNGDGGADFMAGGAGNDRFWVNDAGDVVNEGAGMGSDLVYSSIDYTLGTNVESVHLLDAGGSIDATGNSVANDIWGNSYNNVLSGGGDNDELRGWAGHDALFGDSGSDFLFGGSGADTMQGGSGADTFVFEGVNETSAVIGFDTFYDYVTDFSHAEGDRIDLSLIDANSTLAGNQAFSFGGTSFHGVAGELRFVGGFVQGDLNGDSAVDFMFEVNAPTLSATDFIL